MQGIVLNAFVTGETLVLLTNAANYRSVSLLVCKESLLVNGRANARVASTLLARGLSGQKGVARGPLCGKRAMSQEKRVSPLF